MFKFFLLLAVGISGFLVILFLGLEAWPSSSQLDNERANAVENRISFFAVIATLFGALVASLSLYASVEAGVRQHEANQNQARHSAALDRIDRAMEVVVTSLKSFRVISKALQITPAMPVSVKEEILRGADGQTPHLSIEITELMADQDYVVDEEVLARVVVAAGAGDNAIALLSDVEKILVRYLHQALAQLSIVAVMQQSGLFDELADHTNARKRGVNGGIQLVRLRIHLFLCHFNRHLVEWGIPNSKVARALKAADRTQLLQRLLSRSGAICSVGVFERFLADMLEKC